MGTSSIGYLKFHHSKISSQGKRTEYKSKLDLLKTNFKFTSCSLTVKQYFGRDPIELLNRNSHIQILVFLIMFKNSVSKVYLKPNPRGPVVVFKYLFYC